MFSNRSRQKCNIWHVFNYFPCKREVALLTVNVSIFTTFSVRKRLSNVKLLRQIYQGEQIYSKRSLCHPQKSIELVLNVMQIPNFTSMQKWPKPSKWKRLRLVGYLVFFGANVHFHHIFTAPTWFCKSVLTHRICCMSKHEVKTAFTVFARVENAKEI